MNARLVVGGPGCGKTTRLLDLVGEEMSAGLDPSRIAFVAFTRAAAREASTRAAARFGLDPSDELPHFRTIHSMAYAQLGVARDEVMGARDWREFADVVGEELTSAPTEERMPSRSTGDAMLRVVDYAATTGQSLLAAYEELGEDIEWCRVERFAATLAAYKADTGKMDFTDLLLRYVADDGPRVDVDLAVIDEGQDLTAAQWAVVRRAFAGARRVIVGGDDDQAIYRWAGADVGAFMSVPLGEVLPRSYRLPRDVWRYANAIADRIAARIVKRFAPVPTDDAGLVAFHQRPDDLDLRALDGTVLLLARNSYMCDWWESVAQAAGVPYLRRGGRAAIVSTEVEAIALYEGLSAGRRADLSPREVRVLMKAMAREVPQLRETRRYAAGDLDVVLGLDWEDALSGIPAPRRDFYTACRSRGEDLTATPRVRIETIHGVKGAEADHVALLTDLSARTMRAFQRDADAEHRVFYVGATRARRSLHLVAPQSGSFYPVPDVSLLSPITH